MIIYTVKQGDSLYSIAQTYGTTAQVLARDNELTEDGVLSVGQTLVILQPRTVYTVLQGDTLYSVAQRFGVTVGELWRNNPFLGGTTGLTPGQRLTIVPEPPAFDRPLAVNLYVYPSVDRGLLRQTLPYLTYLTIFSYSFEEDGDLVPPDDEALIELARQYGVAPILLLTSLGAEGTFSPELVETVLTDAAVREKLIEEVAAVLARKRYAGVEVDFEYVPASVADDYVRFIEELKARLESAGLSVFVSLAPKTSADQPGLLYEGHDYGGLGAAADRAFLMTYEWGYTYGPAMAVSPLNQVERVVSYAKEEIPAEKLWLGVPNYGYNWTLPYVRGESRARSLGNVEAVRLAGEKQAAIDYDETAKAPFFRYYDRENGTAREHEVWFEDARSVRAMLELVEREGLDGIGIWNGMRPFPQLWTVLNGTNPIQKVLV